MILEEQSMKGTKEEESFLRKFTFSFSYILLLNLALRQGKIEVDADHTGTSQRKL